MKPYCCGIAARISPLKLSPDDYSQNQQLVQWKPTIDITLTSMLISSLYNHDASPEFLNIPINKVRVVNAMVNSFRYPQEGNTEQSRLYHRTTCVRIR